MPNTDLIKRRETWNRWYQANKQTHHKRVRDHARRRRIELREWLNSLKEGKSCVRCGFSHPAALDYHHIKGKKLFHLAVAATVGYAREKILKEIAKCELICANCHRVEHLTKSKGVVAQSGERTVVNRKVAGSKPASPAKS